MDLKQRMTHSKWLKNYRAELELKMNEINQKLEEIPKRKKHAKNQQANDRNEKLERVKALSQHIEKLKDIQIIIDNDQNNSNSKISQLHDSIWPDFQSLLETLYENFDNSEHNAELHEIYSKFELSNQSIKPQIEKSNQMFNSESQKGNKQTLNPRLAYFTERQAFKPFGDIKNSISDQPNQPNTLAYKLQMIDISYKNIPQGTDYYPPPQERVKISSKSLFPKYKIISHQVFSKLENETLFYIFYYHKEPYEQYMAARELKSRQWLFHKKFTIWLKKSDNKGPYETTEDYIKGQFLYFEHEKAWLQKKKPDFTFKMQYLDNEIY